MGAARRHDPPFDGPFVALAARRLRPTDPPAAAFRSCCCTTSPRARSLIDRLLARIGRARRAFWRPTTSRARLATATPDGACPVLVSFDDGFASNHALAKSLLSRHGIQALFFVCPGLMDLPRAQQPAVASASFAAARTPFPDMMS